VYGCRLMSENALPDRDFRGSLVEACRPESASVGVGWGQRSKSNWLPSSRRGCHKRSQRAALDRRMFATALVGKALPERML
jgi:hypothetical protein